MRRVHSRVRSRCGARRAATLVEVAISTLIVSTMLVAAVHAVGAAKLGQRQLADRARGALLAEDLMQEILQQRYCDPDYAPGSFGVGADEVTGDRSRFEDVDDYDGWAASPPQAKDGTALGGLAGWERRVAVAFVRPSDLSSATLAEITSGSLSGMVELVADVESWSASGAITGSTAADIIEQHPDLPSTDPGIKRITVSVSRDGAEVARLVALRTYGWPVQEN